MKKAIALILALAMCFCLFAGCGKTEAPATSTPSAPSAPSAPADKPEAPSEEPSGEVNFDDFDTYELTMSMHDPATSNNGKFWQAWADEINALTDGHVNITIFFSSAIAAGPDVADMVETGGCDLGWIFTTFYPDQFPLSDITSFPFLGFGNAVSTTNAIWDLWEEYPELQEEWSAYKVLALYGNPGMLFASTQKPVTSPEDVKNQVMRTPSGPITDMMIAMGGSPVVLAPPEIFDNVQKNVISGYVFEPAGITNFSLQEAAATYYTNYAMYDGVFSVAMNWDTWNSLPAEFQAIIESVSLRAGSLAAAEDFNAAAVAAYDTIAAVEGNEWIELTDDQIAAFKAVADEVNAKWIEKYSANGFDYASYAARAQEIVAGY